MSEAYYRTLLVDISDNLSNGASESIAVGKNTEEFVPSLIVSPASISTITHVKIQVAHASPNGEALVDGDFKDIYVDGAIVLIPLVAGAASVVPASVATSVSGASHMRLVTTVIAGTATDPGTDLTFTVVLSEAETVINSAAGVSTSGVVGSEIQGNTAHDAVDAGKPVKVGAKASSAQPSAVAAGDRVDIWAGLTGALVMGVGPAGTGGDGVNAGFFHDSAGTARGLNPLVWNGTNYDRARGNTTGAHQARRKVAVSVTAAAAGDYAANDIISQSATDTVGVAASVAAIVDTAGQVARLVGVVAKCTEDSVLFRLRLHFYDYNPAAADVELDDNAVADFAKNSTGATGYKGYVDLPAFQDMGTSLSMAQIEDMKKLIATNATTGLFMVIQTLDAEANETASMVLTFDLYFES